MPTGHIGGCIMILKDFKDIYSCTDIEYLRTIPRSKIKLFFETIMVENPDYIRKLRTNGTLEYLCRPLFDSVQNSYSVDLGKMIKILKEDKEKIYSKDLYWAILFMPTLCHTHRNARNSLLKEIYVYLRNIEVSKKRAINIIRFILFFDAMRNHETKEIKELIVIFGKKHILSLLEIKKKLYTMKYPSKEAGVYYTNMCLERVEQIFEEDEIYSFSKCPINKNTDLKNSYNKRLLDLKYILVCEFYLNYMGNKPEDPNYFNNVYIENILNTSMRDTLSITNFYNLYYYGMKGRLNFD